ncbi:beta-L-arabinofuranosidase domain-containing protein [Pseudonocardia nigra]|uniref:beta-L-arabinofuranosidase domain-containing protein n=1 Tax=Pseudonocardia nigra TaxID=1921578 RepID=UPI001C5DEAA7|nr:beta-L-arabinofuranosidase domain-containing protein [Pseudonocardia nigra]
MTRTDPVPSAAPAPIPSALAPAALRPLPLGQLRPSGWLRDRLRLQADGLAGHLDEFWPDVAESAWIGGTAEGWERGPYWLDGVVSLAFLLDDPALIAKVTRWIEHILEHQGDDGWLGPRGGDPSAQHHAEYGDLDVWPRMIVLKALLQYEDATADPRVLPAALRFARLLDALLDRWPLHEWGRSRWADLVWVLHELHDRTGEDWLLALADTARRQGYDWFSWAQDLPYREKVPDATLRRFQERAGGVWMNDDFLATHGPNVAMGLKSMPVWWRRTGDDDHRALFAGMIEQLDAHHGQANGLFSCDEHLAGRHPSQGSETCAVVEYLFSLEVALEAWGYAEPVAGRLERLALNALPASVSPDEWAHQYVQQANQVIAHVTEDRVYTNNGPDANVFGLQPHFGCCTANRHQGWPKYVSRLWMRSADAGLIALSYAPCTIDTAVAGAGVQVEVAGDHPFRDEVRITVRADGPAEFPLRLRVPGWADAPDLVVDGGPAEAMTAGTLHELRRDWAGEHTLVLRLPAPVRATRRYHDAVAVERGPLVFALAVGEDWRQVGGEPPHADWEVRPTTPWNYALEFDPDEPGTAVHVEHLPVGTRPFAPDGAPVRLHVRGRRVAGWELEHGAAAAPPPSPVRPAGPLEDLVLLPYGCTNLRVTELPWSTVEDARRDGEVTP